MENYNSYFITLILMIICLLLDYGINKHLEIFGYIINAKKIDMQKYELQEQSKNEIERSTLKNNNSFCDSNLIYNNEMPNEVNSKSDPHVLKSLQIFNNLCMIFCFIYLLTINFLFFMSQDGFNSLFYSIFFFY